MDRQPVTRSALAPVTIRVGPGAIVAVGGHQYCVKRFDSSDSVIARDVNTAEERVVTLAEITASSLKADRRIDMAAIDPDQWEVAYGRYKIIEPILKQRSKKTLAIQAAVEKYGVSRASIYRWLDDYSKTGSIKSLLRKKRVDAGTKRLEEVVEVLIKEAIKTEYLTSQKKSPTRAYEEVKRLARLAGIKSPSFRAFQMRLDEIAPEERAKRRGERKAATALEPVKGAFDWVDTPGQMLQIDHTWTDIEVVDEVHRIAIGRPWLTVAICVDSRMVVSWYLSLDPPGTLATGICIALAILPKDKELARLGLKYPWPCQGKPGIIHADNAREFRGETLRLACQNHGFDIQFRPVKKPKYGAHIERYLGTTMKEIHALPGTTFSNPQQKEDYDSAGKAVMTLTELDQWLGHFFLGKYHNRVHKKLGCPPIKRYMDGIMGDGTKPGIGIMQIAGDPEHLWIDFLPFETRAIHAYGVEIDNITYQADALTRWIGRKNPDKRGGGKFIFRRDPRNISTILFYDPDMEQYYPIPYRNPSHPAISLWELRAAHRYLKEQGKKAVNEDMLFYAISEMRRVVDEATVKTRKQRLADERRRSHDKAPIRTLAPVTTSLPQDDNDEFDPATITPFQSDF